MRRLGFAPGDTLAIQMANSPGYIVVILAAWYLGVTCAGIIPFSVSSEYHPGGRGGGAFFWECAAGQGVFFELPALAQGVFYELPELALSLACFFYDFSGHF